MNTPFCSPGRLFLYFFYLAVVFLLLLSWRPVRAQQKTLSVGDTVPDVELTLHHYKSPKVRLSHFKDQWLILDFWATWCAPCVYMIPRMDSLQKQFEGRVRFLAVTAEPADKVKDFRKKFAKKQGERISYPEAVEEKVLHNLFNVNSLPHYVWINPQGVVKAVTEMGEITREKIEAVLSSPSPDITQRKDELKIPYNKDYPLLLNGNGGDGENLLYHSVFTSYTPGLSGQYSWHMDRRKPRRITATNCNRYWLYRIAYAPSGGMLDEGSVVIESDHVGKLTSDLHGQAYREWMMDNNGFCYELILPVGFEGEPPTIMQQDLQKLIPEFVASMENRMTRCLALVRTNPSIALGSTSAPSQREIRIDPFGWKLTHASLGNLVSRFNMTQNYGLKLVDQTGFKGPADLEVEGDIRHLPALNMALSKYGLMLTEKDIERPVLVIRDRINQSINHYKH